MYKVTSKKQKDPKNK